MKPITLHLPEAISDPEEAKAFAQAYLPGNLYQRLAKLEKQTLFMLMVDTLETTEMELASVNLQIPDGPDDSIWLTIQGVDPNDEDTVSDCDAAVGGAVIAFIESIPQLDYDGNFCTVLSDPLTHENKWQVASTLFGKKVSSHMERAYMAKKTQEASSPTKRPRI